MRSASVVLTLSVGDPVTIDFGGDVPNYSAINPKLPEAFVEIAYSLAEFCSREGREVSLSPRRRAGEERFLKQVEIDLVSESKEPRHYKLVGNGNGLSFQGDQLWVDHAATVATDLLKLIVAELRGNQRSSFPQLALQVQRRPLGDLAAK